MGKILKTISASPLFNGLHADQHEKIRDITLWRDFKKGGLIFSEGDVANGLFIVASGAVKVFKASMDGKEQILHILGPGEPFGEVPVFSGQSFPANAQATVDASVLFIKRSAFVNLIVKNPSLALNMLAFLSLRLRQFAVQVESLSLKEVPGRLAGYIIYLSEQQKNTRKIYLGISKGQLASLLGTIPETLSRIFLKMNQQGLISVKGGEIEILDLEKLRRTSQRGL